MIALKCLFIIIVLSKDTLMAIVKYIRQLFWQLFILFSGQTSDSNWWYAGPASSRSQRPAEI